MRKKPESKTRPKSVSLPIGLLDSAEEKVKAQFESNFSAYIQSLIEADLAGGDSALKADESKGGRILEELIAKHLPSEDVPDFGSLNQAKGLTKVLESLVGFVASEQYNEHNFQPVIIHLSTLTHFLYEVRILEAEHRTGHRRTPPGELSEGIQKIANDILEGAPKAGEFFGIASTIMDEAVFGISPKVGSGKAEKRRADFKAELSPDSGDAQKSSRKAK